MSEDDLALLRPYWYPTVSVDLADDVHLRSADAVSLRYRRALAGIGVRHA